jgi:hypothetical protein
MTGIPFDFADELLTVDDEVAALARISRKTLDAWRREKYGPAWVPMGKRRILYRRSARKFAAAIIEACDRADSEAGR